MYTHHTQESPCEGCRRACNYTQCRVYRLWLNRCWNRYRRWQEPEQRLPPKENVWRYDSPALIHDFLEKGPCCRCAFRSHCQDQQLCDAYRYWLTLRWKQIQNLFARQ